MADPGFGLYVHWPFCQAKCPYCDFNSHVSASVDHDLWRQAFTCDLDRLAQETEGRALTSIYFGGGTPSLMEPATVATIIDTAQRHWRFANDIEITLEANPTSVEASRFQGFRAAGVARVSVGIQALNDTDLKALGRLHTAQEAIRAHEVARAVFPRTSFDLIYARQNQSLADWEEELSQAIDISGEHLSLYQLTIEPGTAFGARFSRGQLKGLPDEDLGADMYDLTQSLCEAAGLPAYEVSNHARPGAESRHNLTYWRGGDWLGVGPGAHGRLTLPSGRWTTEATSAPTAWLNAALSTGTHEARTRLSPQDAAEEYLMMSLRTAEGSQRHRLTALPLGPKIEDLELLGMLWSDETRIGLTSKGRPLLNAVLRELLA